ncbi:hypothetical protein [Rhodococcus sp. NPDC003348]
MNIRRCAVRAFGATAIAATAFTGAGATATAAPTPAPVVYSTLAGPTLAAIGQNSFCHGLIDTSIETDPARPGVATVVFTSRGMHGLTPDWAADPYCRLDAEIVYGTAFGVAQVASVPLRFGERPGETVRSEVVPGSGLAVISVQATFTNASWTQLRPQFGVTVKGNLMIP